MTWTDARRMVAPGLVSARRLLSRQQLESARRLLDRASLNPPGLVGAVLFLSVSLTPSLLPRTWLVQGVISGLAASVGYGSGVAVGWLWRRTLHGRLPISQRVRVAVRPTVVATALLLLAVSLFQGSVWQRDLYTMMGEPSPGRGTYLGVLMMTALLVAAMIGLARTIRFLARWITLLLRRWIPPLPARVAGVTAVTLLTLGVVDGVVIDGFVSVATATSETVNETGGTQNPPPTAPTRSGSPESLVTWDSLGRQGRSFVSGGPTLEELRQFGGPGAKEPVRVYVGLQSAPTISDASALAVRELERTGGFSRSVLCVVTTTGTGWVDPYVAAALEYVHNGDTAIVGTQFSYLPSWISYLNEKERVAQAGRDLFDQVHARWSALPEGERPRLLVFGESLGSLGSEATFRDLDDIRARTDGVLWAGPTNANPLWSKLVKGRDPGSTEVLPVYDSGETVRFVSQPADLYRPIGEWRHPRVVYLQNPSDPVTWWSADLLFREPDWLNEPPGHDVMPAMRWYPVVTFLQVAADLALAKDAPGGHGHRFHQAAVAAWVAIAPPEGSWSDARTAELTRLLDGS